MGREGYLSLCRAVKIFRRAVVIVSDSEGGLSEIGEQDTFLYEHEIAHERVFDGGYEFNGSF